MSYYTLLSIQIRYILYKPIADNAVKQLDSCITCFLNKDSEKLARCYLYKGNILYEKGKLKESIWNLKECERITNEQDNPELTNKLYRSMIMVNNQGHNYSKALSYGRKLLKLAQASSQKEWLATANNFIAVSFHGLEQDDSALYYINRCIPYLTEVSPQGRVIILDNIGYLNMNNNQQVAMKYLRQAAAIGPSVDTYDNMAKILARQGHEQQADSLWNLALEKCNIEQKCQIIKNIQQHKNKTGQQQEANRLGTWLLNLSDSLSAEQKTNKVEVLQNDFENQTAQTQTNNHSQRLELWIMALTVVLIVASFSWMYKEKGTAKKQKKQQSIIDEKNQIIQDLKTQKDQSERELAHKSELIDNMMKKRMENLKQGETLFDEIMHGGTICSWTKEELLYFLDFYLSKNKELQREIARKYKVDLSSKQKFFLCLVHAGLANPEIARVMGVAIPTLRNIRYKLRMNESGDRTHHVYES